MAPLERLKSLLAERYVSEDGDEYKIELLPSMTELEIDDLAKSFPSGRIPEDIRELLKFARGFEFNGLEEVRFDAIRYSGFPDFLFPYSVELAGDGLGNSWVMDLGKNGDWGHVYYVCHDTKVVVRHSENLTEFIEHIHEFGKDIFQSNLWIIHEEGLSKMMRRDGGFTELETARKSEDKVLKNFALSLPENYVVADLRNKPNRSGFVWGKFGPKTENTIRHEAELLWGIEKQVRTGFWSKIFGW
jgi:cell wall assembly regulator SMI1